MVKLKKYRVHKAICSVCNGNGFVKIMKEDAEPHVHQCWESTRKESFMYMNPKYLNMMMLITMIVLLTSSCTNKGEYNPASTIVRLIFNIHAQ